MIFDQDLISHDEMFSDICKIQEIADGLCLEVEAKMVSRAEGDTGDSLTGRNASTEGPEGKGMESTVITGVDIVLNHHLQETSFTEEVYKKYLKDCIKSIKGTLEEETRKSTTFCDKGCRTNQAHLANFKNYQFFIGENMNPYGKVSLREDGVTPYIYIYVYIYFKDGWKWKNINKFDNLALSPVILTGCCFSSTHQDWDTRN
uniref:Translationally-controlled tumor protein n=1 Tax=Rhinolophus ferrumequinum TaxID=59479 RepID=A0A671EW04_RHIFE